MTKKGDHSEKGKWQPCASHSSRWEGTGRGTGTWTEVIPYLIPIIGGLVRQGVLGGLGGGWGGGGCVLFGGGKSFFRRGNEGEEGLGAVWLLMIGTT